MNRPNDPGSRSTAGGTSPEAGGGSVGRLLDPELLDRTVFGANLRGGPLRDELGEGPSLLVFLRHFG